MGSQQYIFISYSHRDMAIANAILSSLEQNKVRCWIDYRDATPGEDYASSIIRAIKGSKILLMIFSTSSNNSKQVLNEINCAVNVGITIIPFKIEEFPMGDSFEYYIGKTHWLDAINPPIQKHIDLLCEQIKSILGQNEGIVGTQYTVQMTRSKGAEVRAVKYDELLALGYTADSIAMQLVENDYIVCNGIGQENEGNASQWAEILMNQNETFQYLINKDSQIVGDWSMVALSDEITEKAMLGRLLEKDIVYENTEFIGFPDVYNGYMLTFSLLPEYRNANNYMLLVNSWLKQLEEYSDSGVFFKRWVMNVFSKEVESLVKRIGFRYLCDNIEFGKIYYLEFMPLPNLAMLNKYQKLVKNYGEKD